MSEEDEARRLLADPPPPFEADPEAPGFALATRAFFLAREEAERDARTHAEGPRFAADPINAAAEWHQAGMSLYMGLDWGGARDHGHTAARAWRAYDGEGARPLQAYAASLLGKGE